MRIIARCYGLCMILLVGMMIFITMMTLNVKKDELNVCLSTAVTSTQIVVQEQIEDYMYSTNNRRRDIDSNEAYLNEFMINFFTLVSHDENYKIKVFGIDYTKGFIDIEVESHVKLLSGDFKVLKSRKTSIVDVLT